MASSGLQTQDSGLVGREKQAAVFRTAERQLYTTMLL